MSPIRKIVCGIALLAGAAIAAAASQASAAVIFIDWSSPSAGSGGGINAAVSSTVNAGSVTVNTFSASDAGFITAFASSFSGLRFGAPATSTPGDIASSFAFSTALPSGAKLLVADVDFRQETVTLSSSGTPLTLLDQVESMTGATSSFPTYDAGLGVLASTIQGNDFEVSIFDLSGLTSLQLGYTGGGISSAVGVAIALPDAPSTDVPAPAAWLLLSLATGGTLLAVRRRRGGSHRRARHERRMSVALRASAALLSF